MFVNKNEYKKIFNEMKKEMEEKGLSFGEMVRECEINGKFGHFQNSALFCSKDSNGGIAFGTRDFWIEAGVNQTIIFEQYLGTEEHKIPNIQDSLVYLKPILDRISSELISDIKDTETSFMLRKLFLLYECTYNFYKNDRKTREVVSKINADYSTITLENNQNITLILLDGLSVMIENCVLLQHENEDDKKLIIENEMDLFDSELLIKTYLYGLISRLYTKLNLCKNSQRNYAYCHGIEINAKSIVPIKGIIHHPLVYTSVLVSGNQNVFAPKEDEVYYRNINTTPIGDGFTDMYDIEFLDVIKAFHVLRDYAANGKATIVCISELKKLFPMINHEKLIEFFSISKDKLLKYTSDKELYIFRVGSNEYRLDIRPIVLIDSEHIFISPSILSKSINIWLSLAMNGGRPYIGVDQGKGDSVIDGFGKREEELGEQLVDLLFEKLEKHYPNAIYKDKDVKVYKIFGKEKAKAKTDDYDIIYYTKNELFLIEAKFFTDSPTANRVIGDYNKMFKNGRYYEHCRGRYDLVQSEPEKMKSFVNAKGTVDVHYLFVSSKPLEIEFQDNDSIVTFLSVANFDNYIEGKLEDEDGNILRPTHKI